MRLRIMSSPDWAERWKCGISLSSSAIARIRTGSASMESIEDSLSRFSSGTCLRIFSTSVPKDGVPGRSRAIGGQVHPGQHDLGKAFFHQPAGFRHHGAHAARCGCCPARKG